MKKVFSTNVLLIILATFFSVNAARPQDKKAKTISKAAKVEVYYFHYTRRCITCNAVENVTKQAIVEMYPSQFKKEQITFTSVNLDDDNTSAIAQKCKAEGQALLIMSKGKRIDLTDKGFMYAKNSPEKLKAEVKKAIDALL